MSDYISKIQRGQAEDSDVRQHINEAYECIWNDKDPSVEPTVQLKEGWKNGNIGIGTGTPSVGSGEHTWDLYLQVASITSSSWEPITAIYVRVP